MAALSPHRARHRPGGPFRRGSGTRAARNQCARKQHRARRGRAGITIDPSTGDLLIGSDQSNQVAQMQSDGTFVRFIELAPQGINLEVTGLDINASGDLLASSTRGAIYALDLDPTIFEPTGLSPPRPDTGLAGGKSGVVVSHDHVRRGRTSGKPRRTPGLQDGLQLPNGIQRLLPR